MNRPELTYDGFGINGPDKHRGRVATFEPTAERGKYGPMFEAAPDMLAALKQALPILDAHRRASGGDGDITAALVRSAIAKAEGERAGCSSSATKVIS